MKSRREPVPFLLSVAIHVVVAVLILNAALTAWGASQFQQQISQNTLVNSIAAMTNLTVSTMNAVGVFKKTAAPAANVPPVSSK